MAGFKNVPQHPSRGTCHPGVEVINCSLYRPWDFPITRPTWRGSLRLPLATPGARRARVHHSLDASVIRVCNVLSAGDMAIDARQDQIFRNLV